MYAGISRELDATLYVSVSFVLFCLPPHPIQSKAQANLSVCNRYRCMIAFHRVVVTTGFSWYRVEMSHDLGKIFVLVLHVRSQCKIRERRREMFMNYRCGVFVSKCIERLLELSMIIKPNGMLYMCFPSFHCHWWAFFAAAVCVSFD